MATIQQMKLCGEIFNLAMTVTSQGAKTVHAQYAAHVDSFSIYQTDQPEGWTYTDHWVCLGNNPADGRDPIAALNSVKQDLMKLLDVDADGVPV